MNLQANLSKREGEVASYMAAGHSKKEIAGHLSISNRTVENTARNIYEKAEVRSVGQLCAWYFCKTFNIDREHLPTISFKKVQGLACVFLTMLVMNEVYSDTDFVRPGKTTTAKTKAGKRRAEDDDTINLCEA